MLLPFSHLAVLHAIHDGPGISLVLLWGFGLWFLDGMFNWFGSLSSNTSGFETLWLPKITWSNKSHNLKRVFEVNVGWPWVCRWQSLLLSRSYSFSGRWGTWWTNWASHFMQRRAYCLSIKCRDLLTEPRCPYGGVFVRCWICSQILSTHAERRRYLHALCMWCDYISTTLHDSMIADDRCSQARTSTNSTNMIRHVHVLKSCTSFTYFEIFIYIHILDIFVSYIDYTSELMW